MPIDRTQLPEDASVLQRMVLDLIAQLDAEQSKRFKTEQLLRHLLAARTGRKGEQLTREQLALFAEELKAQGVNLPEERGGEEACLSGNVEVLRRFKVSPETDDLSELLKDASLFAYAEMTHYLLDLGAKPNDKANGGSSALERCLSHLDGKTTISDFGSRLAGGAFTAPSTQPRSWPKPERCGDRMIAGQSGGFDECFCTRSPRS